jgi:hypothetical protein
MFMDTDTDRDKNPANLDKISQGIKCYCPFKMAFLEILICFLMLKNNAGLTVNKFSLALLVYY